MTDQTPEERMASFNDEGHHPCNDAAATCEICGEPAARKYPGTLCEQHFAEFQVWVRAKRRGAAS